MSSVHSFSTVSEADDISLALTIDEIRWLHASEAIVESPTEEPKISSITGARAVNNAINSSSNVSSDVPSGAFRLTRHTSTSSVSRPALQLGEKSLLTGSTMDAPQSNSRNSPPSSYKSNTLDMPTSTASFPHSLRTRTPASSLRHTETWQRHRHYHLERDVDVSVEAGFPDLDLEPLSVNVHHLPSSISEPTTPTRSPSLKVKGLINTSSSTPIPVSISAGSSSSAAIRVRSATCSSTASSPPPKLSLSLPNPSAITQRKEWIYRHPKPRAAPLSLTTVTAASTSAYSKIPSPQSPSPRTSSSPKSINHPSRLPVPVRVRTRTISSSSTSPLSTGVKHMYSRPRRVSGAGKQRPRPQTGYIAPTSTSDTQKQIYSHGYVHSTLPTRTRISKKAKEKEKPFWALLRSGKNKDSEEDDGFCEGPGSRILDIANSAATASNLLLPWASEADGDDAKDKPKLKRNKSKAKSIALVIGRGRPPQENQKCSASLSSSMSSTSTIDDGDTVSSGSTATPLRLKASASTTTVTASGTQSSTPSTPPRNRASSSSSDSSASSAHSTSTAATSPSPSVSASPKPPPAPAKSILTRSSSTSSRAPPPSGLAAFFGRSSTGSGSGPSSMKSVTFVEEPTVHYPYDVDSRYSVEEGGECECEDGENRFASGSEGGREDQAVERVSRVAEAEVQADIVEEDDLGSIAGFSQNALAWEMGVDLDTMDLITDADSDCGNSSLGAGSINLDTELLFDIGQSYTPRERASIGGIKEEEEDELEEDRDQIEGEADDQAKEGENKKGKVLKRFLGLAGAGVGKVNAKGSSKSNEKSKRTGSGAMPIRPTISGPFALGSVPPSAPSSSFQSRSLPSPTIHVYPAAGRSQPHLRGGLSRSRSNSSTISHTSMRHPHYPRESYSTSSAPTTPIHLKCHSYSHPPRSRYLHDISKTDPVSSSAHDPSLHHAPSTESFRSIAGRSVRSLGSVRSTASTSGFRAWLARVGEGKA